MRETRTDIAGALIEALVSPNVSDSNLEPVNLVDVADRMADALWKLARTGDDQAVGTLKGLAFSVEGGAHAIAAALYAVAAAIHAHGEHSAPLAGSHYAKEREPCQ